MVYSGRWTLASTSGSWNVGDIEERRVMRRLLRGIGAVVLALLLLLILIGLVFRSNSARAVEGIKQFNKLFLNPLMLRLAGKKGFYAAALRHVGRTSGNQYTTPVLAESTPDGFLIPLPYGIGVDWLKNVQAAGSAELVTGGIRFKVGRPQLISAGEAGRHLPVRLRRRFNRYGVNEYLRLYVVDQELALRSQLP